MTIAQAAPRRGMTRKQRRLVLIGLAGVVLTAAVALILVALNDRIVFFNSPSDVIADPPGEGERIRLGGLVAEDSWEPLGDGVFQFAVTDMAETIQVTYRGLLPDLFREGQGVITEGTLGSDGIFIADSVLAKHDEAYMPAEVEAALREQGHWMGDEEAAPAP